MTFNRNSLSNTRFSFLVLVLAACAQPGFSQVTDVAQKVADALTAYGALPVTTTIQIPRTVHVCRTIGPIGESHQSHQVCQDQTVYDPKTTTTNTVVTASNIRVIKSGELTYGATSSHELPDHLIVGDYLARNCTADPATPTFTVTTIFQRTASVALSHSISHTISAGMSVSAKFAGFGATGNISFTDGSTSGNVTTDGSTISVQETRTGSQAVPPHTLLMIELQTWPVQLTVPFSATATIDADLSRNDKGYQHLSDILNEAERTFPISGTLEADDASSGTLVFDDLAYDPSRCPDGSNTAGGIPAFKPDNKTKLTQRTVSNN